MLTDDVARLLADGIAQEEHGRSFEQIAAERDRKLIAVLKAERGG